jgi:molybdopterin-containing oxidoreductase family iron-sulfur binding subunit
MSSLNNKPGACGPDAAAMNETDATPARPEYWRSIAELEGRPEFRELMQREFAVPPEEVPPNAPERRSFMKLMGASLGLAGVACRWQEDKLVPLARREENAVPGETRRYATAMDLGGLTLGLHAISYDGRPIKIEGNPLHPDSLGATGPIQQASVLGVYDPDRSDRPMRRNGGKASPATFQDFDAFAIERFKKLRDKRGLGLRVLSERSSSPTLAAQRQRFQEVLPLARWITYEPLAVDGPREGSTLAFGKAHRSLFAFDQAKLVLTLDADPIAANFPSGVANARALAKRRLPEGDMSRVYAVESSLSETGALADHRLALRAELVPAFVAALDAAVSAKASPLPELGAAQTVPQAQFLSDPEVAKFLEVLAKDLLANVGTSVIVAGPTQPAEVHALVHRLNAVLGNAGRTVHYVEEPATEAMSDVDALKRLTDEMNGGRVETLLILGGNPAYNAPADVPFGEALGRVKESIHLSLYDDETSQRSQWHVNAAHYLESWGDARAWDGTISLIQPLIAPIYGGRSAIELVGLLLGESAKPLEAVRTTHGALIPNEAAFRKALHDGVVAGSAFPRVTPAPKPVTLKLGERALGPLKLGNGALEIVFAEDVKVHDGRFANNAWLQELPEPITKLTWDNFALMNPTTGTELGVEDGGPVTVTLGGKSITLPALFSPGHAEGSVRLTLGYGRNAAGKVGGHARDGVAPVGANTYALRTARGRYTVAGGSVIRSNAEFPRLSSTLELHNIDNIGREGVEGRQPQLLREASLEEYKKNPHFVDEKVHHPPLLNLWQDPVSYDGHKWGMTIDLNKCSGCSSCVTACQAENNIPVVGKENVAKGREMLWLRVDRYYKGTAGKADVTFQPVPCQHCENAPCEQVCPVGATVHSSEGLNDMVYNRCIGTRYCSNNCPYKVRRFNYFNYNLEEIGVTPFTPTEDPKMKVKAMVFNPEVTVRSRGVMEKCTFCVQRIQNVKIKAKNARRPILDGAIKTACQEACPTDAIQFGDLNDRSSKVAKEAANPRAYSLLGELNNRPRVRYLGRVRNPHPELG